MSEHAWVGVGLDGTLAHYDGWVSEEHIGAPIPAMVQTVKRWRESGMEVRIFTARVCRPNCLNVRAAIENWCLEHLGEVLPVTNQKDYGMILLYDDRCVQVIPNTGELVMSAVSPSDAQQEAGT